MNVEPGVGLVIWCAIAFLALPCALVTAAKGRWGWFLLGVFTLVGFILGAMQPPADGSLWQRVRQRYSRQAG